MSSKISKSLYYFPANNLDVSMVCALKFKNKLRKKYINTLLRCIFYFVSRSRAEKSCSLSGNKSIKEAKLALDSETI